MSTPTDLCGSRESASASTGWKHPAARSAPSIASSIPRLTHGSRGEGHAEHTAAETCKIAYLFSCFLVCLLVCFFNDVGKLFCLFHLKYPINQWATPGRPSKRWTGVREARARPPVPHGPPTRHLLDSPHHALALKRNWSPPTCSPPLATVLQRRVGRVRHPRGAHKSRR